MSAIMDSCLLYFVYITLYLWHPVFNCIAGDIEIMADTSRIDKKYVGTNDVTEKYPRKRLGNWTAQHIAKAIKHLVNKKKESESESENKLKGV